MDAEALSAARDRAGVILVPDLRAGGTSSATLARRVAQGELRRTGTRTAVSLATPASDEARLWIAHEEIELPFAFTGSAAATIYGWRRSTLPTELRILVPPTRRLEAPEGVRLVRAGSADFHGVRTISSHPVTSVEVTARETARDRSRQRMVTLLQDLLRERQTTEGRLRAVTGRGKAGSTALRSALDDAGDGAHSRAERTLHRGFLRRGIVGYRRGRGLETSEGMAYWLDFDFDELGVGLEVMGPHHLEPEQFEYDARRARRVLGQHSKLLLTYTSDEILRDVDKTIDDFLKFVRDRGLPTPDQPPGLSCRSLA